MKFFLWVFFGLAATVLCFWLVADPRIPGKGLFMVLYAVVCTFMAVGVFWMMYFSIRHEKQPFPMVLLAFVPYAFLWYYFERVRPGRHAKGNRPT